MLLLPVLLVLLVEAAGAKRLPPDAACVVAGRENMLVFAVLFVLPKILFVFVFAVVLPNKLPPAGAWFCCVLLLLFWLVVLLPPPNKDDVLFEDVLLPKRLPPAGGAWLLVCWALGTWLVLALEALSIC